MEQKIDLEIRLRELAAQSMLETQNEIDVLEVEKSLLTSDQRMNCYAAILEQQRKQLSNPSLSTDSGRGSKTGGTNRKSRTKLVAHANSNSNDNNATDSSVNGCNQLTDVVGSSSLNETTSSPSFSSLSNSQSPSKLSPVSGESANSPSSMSSNHSRTGHHHHHHQHNNDHHTYRRSTSSSSTTLNAKQRAKNKRREQLMQNITSLSNINCNMVSNNKASISISEIRIPLMWRDVDHFKGRGDYKRYAVFCLIKIDSQIYDTQLISDVDREITDVTFDDLIIFNDIDHNFELNLEVYSCVYYEQFSFSSTPRKLKEKLTSSVSKAMGRRLATQTASINYTKELQAYDKSYRFALIANATMRLEDASDTVKTYDLVLLSPSAHHRTHQSTTASIESPVYRNNQNNNNIYNNNNNHHHHSSYNSYNVNNNNNHLSKDAEKNTLPLFGHFCCKLFIRPDVFDKNIKTGYLRLATINATNDNNNRHSGSNLTGYNIQNSNNKQRSSDEMDQLRTALVASSKMATLSKSTSTLHWALLRNFVLQLWPVDEYKLNCALQRGELPKLENTRKPKLTLNIDKYTRLLRLSNSSITIETNNGCFVLGTYCRDMRPTTGQFNNETDEIGHWLRAIEQSIYDSHIWGTVLNHYPPHTRQLSANVDNRTGQATRSISGSNLLAHDAKLYTKSHDHHGHAATVLKADL